MKMSTLLKKCKWTLKNKEDLSRYHKNLLEAYLRQPTTNEVVVRAVKSIVDNK